MKSTMDKANRICIHFRMNNRPWAGPGPGGLGTSGKSRPALETDRPWPRLAAEPLDHSRQEESKFAKRQGGRKQKKSLAEITSPHSCCGPRIFIALNITKHCWTSFQFVAVDTQRPRVATSLAGPGPSSQGPGYHPSLPQDDRRPTDLDNDGRNEHAREQSKAMRPVIPVFPGFNNLPEEASPGPRHN
ncbi:uncharacterized protein BCR38DRAFT_479081 [Pseudomassariella vexata]|uniref:Uncharacterized protein n=1 Tax=Pseudomassariella vexata TaxID=1141098 RepID=A0A1Y2D848_9PEZI|nr:uncharacterized protein BCR38DRAFT_479081 [Pseudomassariella vexata]ORY55439.1 hypothetical protein BCR38DRAFT_479081 [Pseudomassariella vexata]